MSRRSHRIFGVRASIGIMAAISAMLGITALPAQPVVTVRHSGGEGAPTLWGLSDKVWGAQPDAMLAVGERGTILRSVDSEHWVSVASGTTESLMSVAYDNWSRRWVSVGDHGTILRSIDEGLTWSRASNSGTNARLNGIAFLFTFNPSESRWIAVGESGTIVISADGDNWTPVASGTTAWLRGIMFWSGVALVVGQGGTALISDNGPTWSRWTKVPSGTERDLEAITSEGPLSPPVFVGDTGVIGVGLGLYPVPIIATSVTSKRLRSVRIDGSLGVAVGENGTIVANQGPQDGDRDRFVHRPWSRLEWSGNAALNALAPSDRGWIAVGANETILQIIPPDPTRIVNLSSRAFVRGGDDVVISGFAVDAPKRLLVRAAGPVLGQFGVTTPLARPMLTVFDATRRQVAANAGWDRSPDAAAVKAAVSQVGAFPFPTGSDDSAVVVSVPAGSYTAHVIGGNRSSGTTLIEIYDLDPIDNEHGRLMNISTRSFFGSGEQITIPGVQLRGIGRRNLLVRAVGPALAQFGVASPLPDPQILFNNNFTLNNDWGNRQWMFVRGEIRELSRRAGAFALPEGSKDAAAIVSGSILDQQLLLVSDTRGDQGEVLIEIYDVTGL